MHTSTIKKKLLDAATAAVGWLRNPTAAWQRLDACPMQGQIQAEHVESHAMLTRLCSYSQTIAVIAVSGYCSSNNHLEHL